MSLTSAVPGTARPGLTVPGLLVQATSSAAFGTAVAAVWPIAHAQAGTW